MKSKKPRADPRRRVHRPKLAQAASTPERIGERIEQVRKLRELSQEQVGELMRPPKSRSAVWAWENGRSDVTFPQLVDLAVAMRCSVFYLAGGQGTPDVVMSPLQVAFTEGVPVPVVDDVQEKPRTAPAYYPAKPGDLARPVRDSTMAPEFQVGDIVHYRPGKAPKPGKFVWAKNTLTGEVMLRKYRPVKDAKRPGVSYELVPLSEDMVPEDGGEHIEMLGGVMQVTRVYDLD